MHRSPAHYSEQFARITETFYSGSPGQQRHVLSSQFALEAETLLNEFHSENLTLEGMESYAKAHAFEPAATRGVWLSLGISAAHPGPRQHQWVEQAGALLTRQECEKQPMDPSNTVKSGFKVTLPANSISMISTAYPWLKREIVRLLQSSTSARAFARGDSSACLGN